MIKHLLLIKFKYSVNLPEIENLRVLFESIPRKIQDVVSVEWGINNSKEGKSQGYSHSVLMVFIDEQGRESYLSRPDHESLKQTFEPLLDDLLVFDYQIYF